MLEVKCYLNAIYRVVAQPCRIFLSIRTQPLDVLFLLNIIATSQLSRIFCIDTHLILPISFIDDVLFNSIFHDAMPGFSETYPS